MAEFPALPLWTDAFIADTVHLNNEQIGVYIRLIVASWRARDCCLPDDNNRLATTVGMTRKKWLATRPIIAEFFIIDAGFWRQKRLTFEREKVRGLSHRGRKGAAARWEANPLNSNNVGDAQASDKHMPERCLTDAPISISIEEGSGSGILPPPPPSRAVENEPLAGGTVPVQVDQGSTFRELILAVIGVDRSGLTGRGGRILGNQSDMFEARRWATDLGLTEAEQLDLIREIIARKTDGPPGTFKFFTAAMQRLAAEKAAPPLGTPQITRQPVGALQDARPRPKSGEGRYGTDRLNRIIAGAIGD